MFQKDVICCAPQHLARLEKKGFGYEIRDLPQMPPPILGSRTSVRFPMGPRSADCVCGTHADGGTGAFGGAPYKGHETLFWVGETQGGGGGGPRHAVLGVRDACGR
eukprot:2460824-Pyramimonas_sp.AAC.1